MRCGAVRCEADGRFGVRKNSVRVRRDAVPVGHPNHTIDSVSFRYPPYHTYLPRQCATHAPLQLEPDRSARAQAPVLLFLTLLSCLCRFLLFVCFSSVLSPLGVAQGQ